MAGNKCVSKTQYPPCTGGQLKLCATHGRLYNDAIYRRPWCNCLNGRAPGYLADDFRLAGRGRPGSRSAASMMLDIPRTTTSLGDRAFAVAGPRVWKLEQPSSCHP